MAQLSTVLFDLGDVLFHFRPEVRLRAMASASGIAEQKLNDALWSSGFAHECDTGKYNAQEMHEIACKKMNWHSTYDEFRDLWTSAFELDEDVFTVAKAIKPGLQKGILTNNPEILRETVRDRFAKVERLFKPIIFSYTCGFAKPDERIFMHTIQAIGCEPEEILFIDDSQRHVDAAQQVGMRGILFSSAVELMKQLTAYGVLED